MLKQLSKLERTRNVLILGFVALMASVWSSFSGRRRHHPARADKSSTVLAVVGGEEITVGEFATHKLNLQARYSQFGAQFSLGADGLHRFANSG
jgi:hypothetical protein